MIESVVKMTALLKLMRDKMKLYLKKGYTI